MRTAGIKNRVSVFAALSIILLAGCGTDRNNPNPNFPFGGGGFIGGNCNGVPVNQPIPFRVDGAYVSSLSFMAGVQNSPFGNTGQVIVGQSAGGNQLHGTDPQMYGTDPQIAQLEGELQVSVSSLPNSFGRATGGGTLILSNQTIQFLINMYGNNWNNNNNWGNNNNWNNNNNQFHNVCVTGMAINLGISSQVLQNGAQKLRGGNVHLFLSNGNRYSLYF